MKYIRDMYERILSEKSHAYKSIEELSAKFVNEIQEMKRELMFFKGIMHSRGLLEEFRGYVRGVIEPQTTSSMSTLKIYTKMMKIGLDSSTNIPMITALVRDLLSCYKTDVEKLSDNEKNSMSNIVGKELENVYGCLSESIHGMKFSRHSREFIICS